MIIDTTQTAKTILTPEEKKVLDYMRDNNVTGSGYECSCFGIDKELGMIIFYNRHSIKGRNKALTKPIVGVICHDGSIRRTELAAGENDDKNSRSH